MTVDPLAADAGHKINISNCDQRYGTINGSGEVFSNNMRSD